MRGRYKTALRLLLAAAIDLARLYEGGRAHRDSELRFLSPFAQREGDGDREAVLGQW
jgi:hypothetical protein